jgi:hypothetical protein
MGVRRACRESAVPDAPEQVELVQALVQAGSSLSRVPQLRATGIAAAHKAGPNRRNDRWSRFRSSRALECALFRAPAVCRMVASHRLHHLKAVCAVIRNAHYQSSNLTSRSSQQIVSEAIKMGTIALFITVFLLLCIFARKCRVSGGTLSYDAHRLPETATHFQLPSLRSDSYRCVQDRLVCLLFGTLASWAHMQQGTAMSGCNSTDYGS